jgi:hypothetical protein
MALNAKTRTLTELNRLLDQNGFRWRRPTEEFYRDIHGGRIGFFVIFNYFRSGHLWTIRTVAMIRSHQVEEIFHTFSGYESRYHESSYTIGCSLGEYIDQRGPKTSDLEIRQDSDIHEIAFDLFSQWNDLAKPYLSKYASIEAMDHLLNDEPEKPTIHGGAEHLRCERGLILAKLSGRSNYVDIRDTYRAKIRRLNDGYYLPTFEAIARHVEGL